MKCVALTGVAYKPGAPAWALVMVYLQSSWPGTVSEGLAELLHLCMEVLAPKKLDTPVLAMHILLSSANSV